MSDVLTHNMFADCVGDTFRIHADAELKVDVQLIEATIMPTSQEQEGRREPFALVFRGPVQIHLNQQIYRLQHDRLGDLEGFLVPIGPDSEGMRFEAVFN